MAVSADEVKMENRLNGFFYFSGFQTFGADVHPADADTDFDTNALEIQKDAPLGTIMGVTDFKSGAGSSVADIASFCHKVAMLPHSIMGHK